MFENELFQSDQLMPAGQEAKIVELKAEPYEDNRRVLVSFRLSPFSKPPGATLKILDSEGKEEARTELVHILHLENEITLHLPADSRFPDHYRVEMALFRIEDQDLGDEDRKPQINQIDLDSASCSFDLQ
jgi:hypothetical protein